MWALEPDCVDVSRLPAPDAPGPHFAMGPTAHESERQVGERMVTNEVQWLGAKAKELLDAYAESTPMRQPLTFDQIEEIWERDVRPRLKEFESMQSRWSTDEGPSQDSRWYAQWRVPDRG